MGKVFLPAGEWYDFFRDIRYDGDQEMLIEIQPDEIPCYVKAGAIIPMQSVVQHTKEQPEPVLHLHVYYGSDSSSFTYYDDDGATYAFENGAYYKRLIHFNPASNSLLLEQPEGSFMPFFTRVRIYLHGFGELAYVTINGHQVATQKTNYRFISPISNFDPFEFNADLSKEILNLRYIEFNDEPKLTELKW